MIGSHLDEKILELLKNSSIDEAIKQKVEDNLHTLPEKNKKKLYTALMDESKKLLKLEKKEQRLVEKYKVIMARLEEAKKKSKMA